MTLQDMIDNFPNLSASDLLVLNKAAADTWTQRGEEMKSAFKVGHRVSFIDSRGSEYVGTITKILRKNVRVEVGANSWKVSPGALKRIF
jgi:hypothetical protein